MKRLILNAIEETGCSLTQVTEECRQKVCSKMKEYNEEEGVAITKGTPYDCDRGGEEGEK